MIDNALNRLSVKRGSALPHAKLDESTVREILAAVAKRERLRAEAAKLSNKALAAKHGVHERTIDRITAGENWTHVDEAAA